MTGQKKKKVFSVSSSKDGGAWLAGVLRVVQEKDLGKEIRTELISRLVGLGSTHQAFLVVVVAENGHRRFVEVVFETSSGKGRKGGLCLQGGSN